MKVIPKANLESKYGIRGYSMILAREDGAIVYREYDNGEIILVDESKKHICKRAICAFELIKDEIKNINNDKSIHRKSIHHR